VVVIPVVVGLDVEVVVLVVAVEPGRFDVVEVAVCVTFVAQEVNNVTPISTKPHISRIFLIIYLPHAFLLPDVALLYIYTEKEEKYYNLR
jgi:hypothetical protein